jgi:hypothetical protein
MRYIWESGKDKRVMHIAKYSVTGKMQFEALCNINHPFNRSINAPFGLGRKICKRCEKIAQGGEG